MNWMRVRLIFSINNLKREVVEVIQNGQNDTNVICGLMMKKNVNILSNVI